MILENQPMNLVYLSAQSLRYRRSIIPPTDNFVYNNGRKSQKIQYQGLSITAGYKKIDPEQVK